MNFWATWCPPCREEIPDLEKLAELVVTDNPADVAALSALPINGVSVDETRKALNAKGVKEVMYEGVNKDDKDFTALVSKLKAANPDLIYWGGLHTEGGRIRDVAYAGMITRYLVTLDAGGELQVVHQNLETSSEEALERVGRDVVVGWRPEHTVAVKAASDERGER